MELLFKHETSEHEIRLTVPDAYKRVITIPEPAAKAPRKCGQYYRAADSAGGTYYLLAQVDMKKVALVAVGKWGGNRYGTPVLVKDLSNISDEEFNRITCECKFEDVPASVIFK